MRHHALVETGRIGEEKGTVGPVNIEKRSVVEGNVGNGIEEPRVRRDHVREAGVVAGFDLEGNGVETFQDFDAFTVVERVEESSGEYTFPCALSERYGAEVVEGPAWRQTAVFVLDHVKGFSDGQEV